VLRIVKSGSVKGCQKYKCLKVIQPSHYYESKGKEISMLKDTCTPCSLQHYSQLPGYGINQSTPQWANGWKMWCIYILNGIIFSSRKMNSSNTDELNVEDIIVSEIKQAQKDRSHMFSPIFGI
jgi:hypothetical protein